MDATLATKAFTKLQTLSDDRASKVFSLIEDLARLEALEDAEDLKDALESLAEMERSGAQIPTGKVQFANDATIHGSTQTIPYEQLRRECGLDR